jgi:hypothetical protein
MTSAAWRLACVPVATATALVFTGGCTERSGDESPRTTATRPSATSSPGPTAVSSSPEISASPTPTGTAPEDPQEAEEEIRKTWRTFFDPQTEVEDKVDLVENGKLNELMVSGLFADVRGRKLRATVTSVTFLSSLHAQVGYTLTLEGKPLRVTRPGASVSPGRDVESRAAYGVRADQARQGRPPGTELL